VAQSKRNIHLKPYVCESQTLLAMPRKEDIRFTRLIINHRYRALSLKLSAILKSQYYSKRKWQNEYH